MRDIQEQLKYLKKEAHNDACRHQQESARQLKSKLLPALQRSSELASIDSTSSWLTPIPLDEYGLTLDKGSFRDALCLHYGRSPRHLALFCACGQAFTIDYALPSPTGRYPSIRHNEVQDITANILKEVCTDVTMEPSLQPLTGEMLDMRTNISGEETRLGISTRGFW